MRFGFTEMDTIARKVSKFAHNCIFEKDEAWSTNPVELPSIDPMRSTHSRRWYDTCGICMRRHSSTFGTDEDVPVQCEQSEDGTTITCKDGGRTTGWMQKFEPLGTSPEGKMMRRKTEWFGDVMYDHETGCQALGVGKLIVVTQYKEDDEGDEWVDAPEVEIDRSGEDDIEYETTRWSRPLVRIHAHFLLSLSLSILFSLNSHTHTHTSFSFLNSSIRFPTITNLVLLTTNS